MDLFTTHEVAAQLKCTTRTLQNLRDKGLIAFVKVGRLVRYTQQQIDEFLENQKVKNGTF